MLNTVLSSIKSLLADVFPELPAFLNGPATEDRITGAEQQMGRAWPEDLKALYRLHDGESTGGGLFFGMPFLSIKDAMDEWMVWKNIEQEGYSSLDNEIISVPARAIKETYANRYYFPISKDYGGNNFGVDLDPDENGTVGQVINFGRDEEIRRVIAASITDFLEFMLTQLKSRNYVVDEEDGVKTWRLKTPGNSHFLDALRNLPLPSASSLNADAGDYAAWSASLDTTWSEIVAGALRPKESGFAVVADVKTLRLVRKNLSDLRPLEKFIGLRKLILSVNPIRDITPLVHLPELKILYLSRTLVENLQPLQRLSNLGLLNLSGLTLADISSLNSLKKLRSLGLDGCTLPDLEAVSQLKGLTELDISNAHYPAFDCLENLGSLTDLKLAGTNIADLSFLASLKKLKMLQVHNTQVIDYSVLGELPKLDDVTCGFADFVTIKNIMPRRINFAISGEMTDSQSLIYHEYVMGEG